MIVYLVISTIILIILGILSGFGISLLNHEILKEYGNKDLAFGLLDTILELILIMCFVGALINIIILMNVC